MNLLYCGDRNMSDGLLLSVMSIAKQTAEPLNIYILTMYYNDGERTFLPVESKFADDLLGYVASLNQGSSVTLIDISEMFQKHPPTANLATRFTPYCMLRLYADIIPEIPDKILYLDTDILCVNTPDEFYGQDICDIELCGVLDHYGSWFFRNNIFKRDYLNSGVLLLNMSKIRETGLFQKCRACCRDKEMFMPDQTALHKLATHKRILPRCYNEQKKTVPDTVFRHFTTCFRFIPYFHTVSVKPWQIERMHDVLHLHDHDELLDEYTALKASFERRTTVE